MHKRVHLIPQPSELDPGYRVHLCEPTPPDFLLNVIRPLLTQWAMTRAWLTLRTRWNSDRFLFFLSAANNAPTTTCLSKERARHTLSLSLSQPFVVPALYFKFFWLHSSSYTAQWSLSSQTTWLYLCTTFRSFKRSLVRLYSTMSANITHHLAKLLVLLGSSFEANTKRGIPHTSLDLNQFLYVGWERKIVC